jgi:hypothetical protein
MEDAFIAIVEEARMRDGDRTDTAAAA